MILNPSSNQIFQNFRLGLESGNPISGQLKDLTAQATLYATPYGGRQITLFDALGNPVTYASNEFSAAVPALANSNQDVFGILSAGIPALEYLVWRNHGQVITGATNATPIVITANAHGLSNGDEAYVSGVKGNTAANGIWTVANATANTFELATSVGNAAYTATTGFFNARATKIVFTTTGVPCKSGDLTRRYLGTIRVNATGAQSEDTLTKRFIWNYSNRIEKPFRRYETTATWNYTVATVRQANGAAANQVELVSGMPEEIFDLLLMAGADATAHISAGIGEDYTNLYSEAQYTFPSSSGSGLYARYSRIPAPGYHKYCWNEFSVAAGTTAWNGAITTGGSEITSGLTGRMRM